MTRRRFDDPPPRRPRGESLLRVLGRAGVVPGGAVEQYIHSGRVSLDGVCVREPAELPGTRAITIDGKPVDTSWQTHALAFHKRAGIVSDPFDPEGKGTVFEALAKALAPELRDFVWHACGRLDRSCSGLLVFTNDPALVQHLTAPTSGLSKTYEAHVTGVVTDDKLQRLRDGVDVDGHRTAPAKVRQLGPQVVELTITEGRHHQVKKMVAAVGLTVMGLHRTHVGTLEVEGKPGHYTRLTADQLAKHLGYPPPAA